MRFMSMIRSTEKAGPPPQGLMAAIARLGEEAMHAGVLVEMGGLLPSAQGAIVRLAGGKLIVTDGPFAETKEVIGGYAVHQLPSRQAAIEQACQFLRLHLEHWPGWEGECEVRQIFDAAR
jgi:hypothetical protein